MKFKYHMLFMILRTIENADLPLGLPPGYGKNMNKTVTQNRVANDGKKKGLFEQNCYL